MLSSDSEDDTRPRYANKKIRKEIEVDVTDLVVAGILNKDNPATQSALEDSISADLDKSNKKLKMQTDVQRNLGKSYSKNSYTEETMLFSLASGYC